MITYRQTVLTELGSIPKSAGNVFPKTSDGLIKKTSAWAGALVQWLWEETHVPKVVGSNPGTVYWMDIFSHIIVVKIVMFV